MQSPATPPGPCVTLEGWGWFTSVTHRHLLLFPTAAPGAKTCPKFSPTSAGRFRKVQLFGAEQALGKGVGIMKTAAVKGLQNCEAEQKNPIRNQK